MTKMAARCGALMMVAAGLGVTGCATVTRGGNDAWSVSSDPIGAKVETSNGMQCSATPCAIRMSRKSEFTATVTKPGFKTATIQVTHKTAGSGAAGVAGNVLVGGVIGLGVDMYTGASQDLVPNPAFVKLEPNDAPKAEAPKAAVKTEVKAAAPADAPKPAPAAG